MERYFLIIDVETMGMPENWDAQIEDLNNWPPILEIGWQLYENSKNNLISAKSFLIKQDQKIPPELNDITGITQDETRKKGVSINKALNYFSNVIDKFKPIVIAHNTEFDIKVILASALRNDFKLDTLKKCEQLCTMKLSTDFCELPDSKYPSLDELYKKLFNENRPNKHRTKYDVEDTSKAFFKLKELGIIVVPNLSYNAKINLGDISNRQIEQAYIDYLSDINIHPLFYDIENFQNITISDFNTAVKNKLNKFYQTDVSDTFEIPYNRISNRTVITLNLTDTLVRYLLKNYLQERTNFIISSEKYDYTGIEENMRLGINNKGPVIVKIDIENCYDNIHHEKLVDTLDDLRAIEDNEFDKNVFHQALKVIYKDQNGSIEKKEKGVLIGSKPDQYFAELFLNQIEQDIKKEGIQLLRIADEFTFFSENIHEARKTYKKIEKIISDYELSVNRSKTVVKDLRETNSQNNYQLNFEEKVIPGNSTFPNFTTVRKFDVIDIHKQKEGTETESLPENGCEEFIIDSYETAITFIRKLSASKDEISNYQETYPNLKYFYNITFSQPTDFRIDYENLDKTLFSVKDLEKLRTIIYQYPKSEYYTAQAIQLLVFVAKNTPFIEYQFEEDRRGADYTKACKYANVKIIELLESKDIHKYQKYLILRYLFKNEKKKSFNYQNFSIKKVAANHYGPDHPFIVKTPFLGKIKSIVENFDRNTDYYPLKMISKELNKD